VRSCPTPSYGAVGDQSANATGLSACVARHTLLGKRGPTHEAAISLPHGDTGMAIPDAVFDCSKIHEYKAFVDEQTDARKFMKKLSKMNHA
jgi:hypothetical protein